MRFETIKNCGELGLEFLTEDGDGIRVSKDFLKYLMYGFAKHSTYYFDSTREHIFTYREKQLNSVVSSSIADITHSYIMEYPLSRKPPGEDKYSGHVDYWVSYRDFEFLLELKHSFWGYRNTEKPRQSIYDRFNSAINQLQNIRKDECRWHTMNKGIIKIALQSIVFYRSSKERISENDINDNNFPELFRKLINNTELKNKSNMRSLWLLHERLIKPEEYDTCFEVYPAVAFVGKIFDVIT